MQKDHCLAFSLRLSEWRGGDFPRRQTPADDRYVIEIIKYLKAPKVRSSTMPYRTTSSTPATDGAPSPLGWLSLLENLAQYIRPRMPNAPYQFHAPNFARNSRYDLG